VRRIEVDSPQVLRRNGALGPLLGQMSTLGVAAQTKATANLVTASAVDTSAIGASQWHLLRCARRSFTV
jgi:hypothetical protein